jgi:hypothetical protein
LLSFCCHICHIVFSADIYIILYII